MYVLIVSWIVLVQPGVPTSGSVSAEFSTEKACLAAAEDYWNRVKGLYPASDPKVAGKCYPK
jgi:type II secretory pathway component PulM